MIESVWSRILLRSCISRLSVDSLFGLGVLYDSFIVIKFDYLGFWGFGVLGFWGVSILVNFFYFITFELD